MDSEHSDGSRTEGIPPLAIIGSFIMLNNKKAALASVAAGALALAGSASAAVVDVTSVTASIADAATAGGVIGLAVLGMYFGLKLYKWVRSAG